jgi:hypothetical protein
MATMWFNDIQKLEPETLQQLMKMGTRVTKFLEMKDKLKGVASGGTTSTRAVDAETPSTQPTQPPQSN